MKSPATITAIVIGSLVAVGALAVVLGYLSISVKSPHQTVRIATNVCAGDIETYNSLNGQETDGQLATLQKFAEEIDAKKGASDDPNCLFMSAQARASAGDRNTASQRVEALEKLQNESHVYASGAINSLVGLRDLQVSVKNDDTPSKQQDEW